MIRMTACMTLLMACVTGIHARENGNGDVTAVGGDVSLYAGRTKTASSAGSDFQITDLRGALNLYFRSFVWDSRFINYRIHGTFVEQAQDWGGASASSSAMGYGASADFFPRRKIPFSLFYSVYDSETDFEAQRSLAQKLSYTRYGGNIEALFSKAPRMRLQYEKTERESEGNVLYLYSDEHFSGNAVYSLRPSRFEVDYDSRQTFSELSLSLQESTRWSFRNENRLGKKHQVNFSASRTDVSSEQPGFASSEAQALNYNGQWSGRWSGKWNTNLQAAHGESEAPSSDSEADSYSFNLRFSPNPHWAFGGRANAFESAVTSVQREDALGARSAQADAQWSQRRGMWSWTLSSGGGQSGSELEQTDLLLLTTERARFDAALWSAAATLGREGARSGGSFGVQYSSSDFSVDMTGGVVLGAEQAVGYAEDIWKARLEAHTRGKAWKMRGWLDYGASERLLEGGAFAAVDSFSLNAFLDADSWGVSASYGVIQQETNVQVVENTFLRVGGNKRFGSHWALTGYYHQSDTALGVLDQGQERQYEAALNYSAGKYAMRFLAQRRESERGGFSAENAVYSVVLSRRFEKKL